MSGFLQREIDASGDVERCAGLALFEVTEARKRSRVLDESTHVGEVERGRDATTHRLDLVGVVDFLVGCLRGHELGSQLAAHERDQARRVETLAGPNPFDRMRSRLGEAEVDQHAAGLDGMLAERFTDRLPAGGVACEVGDRLGSALDKLTLTHVDTRSHAI